MAQGKPLSVKWLKCITEIKVAASNEMPLILKEHEGVYTTNKLEFEISECHSDFPILVCIELYTHSSSRLQNVQYFQEEGIP